MPLTNVDSALLKRCLHHDRGAWNDFVDRFLGLIYHVIHHTSYLRSNPLQPEDVEDMAAEVMMQIVNNDYAVLRQFRGQSSLATYLTVIARRICVHEMSRKVEREARQREVEKRATRAPSSGSVDLQEDVLKLLKQLPGKERNVVRLFYLEGRTYEEISTQLSMPVNSIGPILSRAKKRLKGGGENAAARKPG